MVERYDIVGYCRISVDEEYDRDNTSIENQKAIIADYVKKRFPESALAFYEDRDRSGYTFEQREGYQRMRRELISHKYDILVVKDFSRFSRRNSRGLVELEDLRDAGVRIISIGDGIDFPNDDDWLKIQFQFLLNEMPVTDTSRKVRAVVRRRQEDGKWICAAPYGYMVNPRQEFEVLPTEAEIVRKIFELYIQGWGYKKIANYLTEEGIPTPRMSERTRREAEGKECRRKVSAVWAIESIHTILQNDFYIGTFRQGKYARKKINGKELKRDCRDHIVLENHHQAIISYRDFRIVQELIQSRSRSCYRGVKKYENTYTGFLVCGDCGSPMFSMSRPDMRDAYRCGTYHRRGLKGCTSHYIRTETLDTVLKDYLRRVREQSSEMIARLNADLKTQDADIDETETSAEHLEEARDELEEELQITRRQRIRDIRKHPEREERLNQSYDALEEDLEARIASLEKQIELLSNRRNTIIRVNRAAKTALEIFDEILQKDKLDAKDLHLIINQIKVYEDHIEISLKSDIDSLLRSGTLPEETSAAAEKEDAANFNSDTENSLTVTLVQQACNHEDKVFRVNVISDGDPLEIYTDRDGGVIFKKYSLMGGMADCAAQLCETLYKTSGLPTLITDRDTVIAVAGLPRREALEKHISAPLESIMEGRSLYQYREGANRLPAVENLSDPAVSTASPILTGGDVMGCVVFAAHEGASDTETERMLAQTASGFLGRQLES